MDLKNSNLISKINISNYNQMNLPIVVCWIRVLHEKAEEMQRYDEHKHNFYEIQFILEGETRYEYQNAVVSGKKDQFMIFPQYRKHKLIYNSDKYIKLAVAFNIDSSSDLYEKFVLKQDSVYEITPEMNKVLQSIFDQIENASAFYDIIISRSAEILMYLVIEEVSRSYFKKIKISNEDVRVVQAKQYILDNPDKFFTCAEVANYCFVSVKQLGRLFEEYEHTSLLAFIHDVKIDNIKKMLVRTNLSQKLIGKKLGFSTNAYFSHFFKKHVGVTPTQYRKKHKSLMDGLNEE